MKTVETNNTQTENRAAAHVEQVTGQTMVMGDWGIVGNGEVVNNSNEPVGVWSNDDGIYTIAPNSSSATWGEDVDHVQDAHGQWWKIGWNTAIVDEYGDVSGAKCPSNGPGGDCSPILGDYPTIKNDTVQTKLTANQPNDRFEQEADSVAERVVSGESSIQRKCTDCEEEHQLQRQPEEEEEELQMKPLLQLKANSRESGQEVQPWVQQQIESNRGSGRALTNETRTLMENGIGADFQNVNIHTGSEAVQMNRVLGARAFTVGNDIYFNSGQYSPETGEGKRLLAHELTHTVQQGVSGQSIQKAPLDHKQLTWADFKGDVPEEPVYDAITASDITDPKVADIKPEEPVTSEVDKDCGEDKTTGYSAKIAYDTSKIEAKAYFEEDTSWKKDWTTDATAQEAKCNNEFVNKCQTSFKSGETKAKQSAAKDVEDCETAAKKLKENEYLTFDCEGTEVQVEKGECESKMKSCFENQRIKSLTYEADNNVGDTFTVSSKADCDTKLLEACKKTLVPNMSKALLSHEQGHFDITNVIAKEIQQNLRDKADGLETVEEGCTEEEAIKNAKAAHEAKKPGDAFKKIWKDGKKKLKDTQKTYDDDTKHSSIRDQQTDWVEKIAVGDI